MLIFISRRPHQVLRKNHFLIVLKIIYTTTAPCLCKLALLAMFHRSSQCDTFFLFCLLNVWMHFELKTRDGMRVSSRFGGIWASSIMARRNWFPLKPTCEKTPRRSAPNRKQISMLPKDCFFMGLVERENVRNPLFFCRGLNRSIEMTFLLISLN